ncbi:MAG: hypothetical protein V8T44_00500 [Odoribacter splanchnicus]
MYMPGAGFSVGGSYHFMDTEDKTTQEPIDKSVKNVWTANARWGHRWGLYHLRTLTLTVVFRKGSLL